MRKVQAGPARRQPGAHVHGRPDALHEDEGGQAVARPQARGQLRAVQVVAAALALRLEHEVVRRGGCAREHGGHLRRIRVVQAPQACAHALVAEMASDCAAPLGWVGQG